MIQDVRIEIRGTQTADGEKNEVSFTTRGRFGMKDGEFFLSYDESEATGLENARTTLFLRSDSSVVMQRTGLFQSRLVIEKGKRHVSPYSTPYGEMQIGVLGESVEHRFTEEGGTLFMCYTLDSDSRPLSRNTVKISVRRGS